MEKRQVHAGVIMKTWIVGALVILSATRLMGNVDTIHITVCGEKDDATSIAVDRLRGSTSATIQVNYSQGNPPMGEPARGLQLCIGEANSCPEIKNLWAVHDNAKEDSWLVQTVGAKLVVSGKGRRGLLYAVYHAADMLRTGEELTSVSIYRSPKMDLRFVSFGATTHGRQRFRPELYWKTLAELPAFGYNGVIIYPGGGTPLGQKATPVIENPDGSLSMNAENTVRWRDWFKEIDRYGMDLMMTVPPVIPTGYSDREIADFYGGGPEPAGYIPALMEQFRTYLRLLREGYPEIDYWMFNSTEGATFGRNRRFFGNPHEKRFSEAGYLSNNEKVMSAYLDVLQETFGKDMNRVMFWTHSFGLTSKGIERMREVLFRYPEITIIEDDFWNNNLWPYDLPAMAYLPEKLRAEVTKRNPFALFQIATDGEYYGGGSLPNAYPDSHVRSAQEALKAKARMVIQRLDLHDRTEYGTAFGTMEIVPLAASRQLWEAAQAVDDEWDEWAKARFGAKAAPAVVAALKESQVIIVKGLSASGWNLLGVGSEFKPEVWRPQVGGVSQFAVFGKPGTLLVDKKPGDTILSGEYTPWEMGSRAIRIQEFRADQAAAAEAVERGLAQVEKVKADLQPEDYAMLRGTFENGRNVLKAVRLLGEAAYATHLVRENFDNVADPVALKGKAIKELRAYLAEKKLISPMLLNLAEIADAFERWK